MSRVRGILPAVVLAAVAYVPLLLTAPGRVAADTKTYLYLDPARLLGRATSMWDPNVGLGTVTHQTIGYLWPMGPWYWLLETLGLPDWLAQRLWLGTVMAAAGLGVVYLLRTIGIRPWPPVLAAALLYELSPYTLHYAARISVLLLPWAALPWLIGLTHRALRTGSWRHPAVFALVTATAGGVNATALVLAGIGPLLWVPFAVLAAREVSWRRAARAVGKIGLLTTLCSLWWISGLAIQGGWGIDILRYTETVETVARTSLSSEVLRGLGYWFFYGGDKLGPWIEPGRSYTQELWLIAVGFAVPLLAVLAALLVRWRHRAYFVALVLVGTAVAVGAYPYGDPSPIGSVFKAFASSSTAGLALRSTPRAVPLVALGLACLVGAGVASLRGRRALAASAAVALIAVAGIPPLWSGDVVGENLQRPEELPAYWEEAAAHLDEAGTSTRVLEVPGSDFASYRWGSTVDPITPFLIDRPYVARELIPYGTPPAADLLNALDRRVQEGVLDPAALAPVARLMGVGDIVLRSDLQYERYKLPRPRTLWSLLTDPVPRGLDAPVAFGPPVPNEAIDRLPLRDEIFLATDPDAEHPPPVAAFGVRDPLPIVRPRAAVRAVVLSGDGEGVVEAAAAGLLGGDGVVLYDAALSGALRDDVLAGDATLVVTDTNRKRGRRWATVRDNTGYTEPAGYEPLRDDPSDARLPVFPDAPDAAFTTMEQHGVAYVGATGYGNRVTFSPHDRPANAIDGDLETSWQVAAFSRTVGERWEVRLASPVTTSVVTVVQPVTGHRNRWITRAGLRVDGEHVGSFDLGDPSRTPQGQELDLGGERSVSRVELEIEADNVGRLLRYDGLSGVGFAEVRIDGVQVEEVVRLPRTLLEEATEEHPLAIVLSRLRSNPREPVRTDEEAAIGRSFRLPSARSFDLGGEARVSAFVPDDHVDRLLGRTDLIARSSRRLPGDLPSRASSAFDGSLETAWRTTFGDQEGAWIEVEGVDGPVSSFTVDLLADGQHSVPTRLRVGDVAVDVPPVADGAERGHTERVVVELPEPVAGGTVRITVEAVRPTQTTDWHSEQPITMPIGIAEIGLAVSRAAPLAGTVAECRADLLTVDGEPVPLRVEGPAAAAADRGALTVSTCDGDPVVLGAGSHDLQAAPGTDSGIDLDRLVLATSEIRTDAAAPTAAPARVSVVDDGRTSFDLDVAGADEPFWLVLGQSHSTGWTASADGDDLGEPVLVDGYANGWLVDAGPDGNASVQLRWTPQRYVWAALALSGLAALACLAIAVAGFARSRRRCGCTEPCSARLVAPRIAGGGTRPSLPVVAAGSIGVGVVAALVVQPWVGLLGVVAATTAMWDRRGRVVVGALSLLTLAAAAAYVVLKQLRNAYPPDFGWPELFEPAHHLAWASLVLLLAVVVADRLRSRPPPD